MVGSFVSLKPSASSRVSASQKRLELKSCERHSRTSQSRLRPKTPKTSSLSKPRVSFGRGSWAGLSPGVMCRACQSAPPAPSVLFGLVHFTSCGGKSAQLTAVRQARAMLHAAAMTSNPSSAETPVPRLPQRARAAPWPSGKAPVLPLLLPGLPGHGRPAMAPLPASRPPPAAALQMSRGNRTSPSAATPHTGAHARGGDGFCGRARRGEGPPRRPGTASRHSAAAAGARALLSTAASTATPGALAGHAGRGEGRRSARSACG
mmetsp:Transcript_27264/g.75001  ORF Transcript_27264/g.75001 Transcript_27264/m.75001 type:complete len:263 (+) Transcript_27264:458-1246(+)